MTMFQNFFCQFFTLTDVGKMENEHDELISYIRQICASHPKLDISSASQCGKQLHCGNISQIHDPVLFHLPICHLTDYNWYSTNNTWACISMYTLVLSIYKFSRSAISSVDKNKSPRITDVPDRKTTLVQMSSSNSAQLNTSTERH